MQIIIPPPIRILSSEAYEYLLHFPPPPSMRRAVSFEKRQSTHASSRIRGIYILIATGEREGKEKKRGGSAHPREKRGRSPSSLVHSSIRILRPWFIAENHVPKDARNRVCSLASLKNLGTASRGRERFLRNQNRDAYYIDYLCNEIENNLFTSTIPWYAECMNSRDYTPSLEYS